MAFEVEFKTRYWTAAGDGMEDIALPRYSHIKAGDLLIICWCANDDDRLFLNDAGWTNYLDAEESGTMENQVWYKFAATDNEQFSTMYTDSTTIYIYLYGLIIRGANTVTPLIAGTNALSEGSSTTLTYPILTATANNQLVYYMGHSDADTITPTTESSVRLLYSYSDSNMYVKVEDAGVIPSFTASIPNDDQSIGTGFIIMDRGTGTTLQPLEVTPIKALSDLTLTQADAGWRAAVYASGKALSSGSAPIVYSPTATVFNGTNQWQFRVDNAETMADCTTGDAITWANGDTATFAEYRQYQTTSGGRGYLVMTNYSGTSVPDNNVGTCGANTCQIYNTGTSYQVNLTNYFKSSIKMLDFGVYNITGASGISISDGIYYLHEHTVADTDNEGHWYEVWTDSKAMNQGSQVSLSTGVVTPTITEYGMINTEYNATYNPEGSNLYWRDSLSGGYRGYKANYVGLSKSFATGKDLSTKKLAIWSRRYSNTAIEGTYFLAIDTSNEWKLWRISNKYEPNAQNAAPEYSYMDMNSEDTPLTKSGTSFNSANVKYIAILFKNISDSGRDTGYTYNQYEILPQTITGGGVDHPVNFSNIKDMINTETNDYGTVWDESVQSLVTSQYVISRDLTFGDGTKYTYLDVINQAISTPSEANSSDNLYYNVDGYDLDLTFNLSAGNFNNSIISSDNGFVLSETDNSIAYSNLTFIKTQATLQSGKTYDTVSFIECNQINKGSAIISNGVFSNSTDSNGALKIDITNTGTLTNTSFDNNNYDIELAGVGAITLAGVTYSNTTTKNLNITATTGTVTITIPFGDTVPTYDTAGATVVISTTSLSVTLTPIIAGTRVRIYNETTNTEIANEIEATTTWTTTYVEGSSFTAGDIVTFYLTKTGYLEKKIIAVAGSAPWIVPGSQDVDTVYNTNGIDGSTVTEFTADYVNNQIDVADSDGSTTGPRLYAWWMNNLTTTNGITNWFGGMVAEDSVNYKNVTAIVNLHLQNTNSAAVQIYGSRIYRDDVTTILATGTGPIQLDPLKAYIAPEVVNTSIYLSFESAVWLDVDDGVDTDDDLCGVQKFPCKTLTKAISIASTHSFSTIQLAGDLTLDQDVSGKEFIGWKNGKINMNSQLAMATRFKELKLYGNVNGIILAFDCRLTNLQNMLGVFERCRFLDTTPLVLASGTTTFLNCVSGVPGSDSPILNYSNGDINVNMRAYSGGIRIINSTDANNVSTYEFIAGKFNFDNTNTLGSFDVRGVIDTTGIDVTAGAIVKYTGSVTTNRELEYNSHLHLDTTSTTTGSVYPFGLPGNPVNNLVDALILCNEYNLNIIDFNGTMNIISGQDVSGKTIRAEKSLGNVITVASGAITAGTYFENVIVSGVMNGSVRYTTCVIGDITNFDGGAKNSLITGDIVITGSDSNYLTECDTYTTDVTYQNINVGNKSLNIIRGRGQFSISDYTGTSAITIDLVSGRIDVKSSCISGMIIVSGMASLTDNSAVGCIVLDSTMTRSGIVNDTWDEQTDEHTTTGSTGVAITSSGGSGGLTTEEHNKLMKTLEQNKFLGLK